MAENRCDSDDICENNFNAQIECNGRARDKNPPIR